MKRALAVMLGLVATGERTVSAGVRADLVLVDGDPRADVAVLRHPRAVMLRGAWLQRP
jgi:imidazolonepropionase-like amidohydrolase